MSQEMDDFVLKQCPRNIHVNKYERNAPEMQRWWNKMFKIMEAEVAVPEAYRTNVVKEIFPNKLLLEICKILSFDELIPETYFEDIEPSIHSDDEAFSMYGPPEKESDNFEGAELFSHLTQGIPEECVHRPRRVAGPNNPYLKFFKRRPDRTAIWRELPPLSLDGMNLTQKAEAITKMIAVDFVDWLKNMGGDEQPTLDVPTIIKMFQIGFHTHAATSLCVRVKEFKAVPKQLAEARNIPEAAIPAVLHRQLLRDIKAQKEPKRISAFGGIRLPCEQRYIPPKLGNLEDKWMGSKRVPKDLKTMAAVWEGITHLRSTRGYCSWLTDHPEIAAPEYLMVNGFLEPDYLYAPHMSIETQDSLSLAQIPAGLDETPAVEEQELEEAPAAE